MSTRRSPATRYSRVACETLLTTGLIVVAGEITTASTIDYAAVARKVVNDIGYDNGEYYFDGNAVGVIVAMDRQSPDIAQGVDTAHEGRIGGSEDPLDRIGAGDQGMMFGYATNETPELHADPDHRWRTSCRSGCPRSGTPGCCPTCGRTARPR